MGKGFFGVVDSVIMCHLNLKQTGIIRLKFDNNSTLVVQPILLSEVEQEQRPSENGDREAMVVGAGLCDGEGERAYTVYDLMFGGEKLFWCN